MSRPSLSSCLRLALITTATTAAAGVAQAATAPCTGGAAVYEGSRSAVLADQALWQRSGMADVAVLARYAPEDPTVLQARREYERLRTSDAYPHEVSRIAAARGETLSGFSGTPGCEPAR